MVGLVARGVVNGAPPVASRRATAIVVAALCLILVAKTADAVGSDRPAQVPFVAALFVLPLVYAVPATRHWWTAHRFWLLGTQAVLTYAPFAVFGRSWVTGVPGLLAGLVLLTVASPASWLLFGALTTAEVGVRAGVVGLPVNVGASAALWVLVAYVDDALVLFGLARLADMVAQVHAARGELAGVAVSRERLRAAGRLRSAVGERLTAVSDRAGAALQAAGRSTGRALELITEAGGLARQALADVRGTAAAAYRGPDRPDAAAAPGTGTSVAPRLAMAVLAVELCAFAAQEVNNVLSARLGPAVTGAAVASGLAVVALQLRHSRPAPAGDRPRAWPWTLAVQALLVYGMFPALGWITLGFCGFLGGSALLLLPGRRPWAAYGAVVASVPVLLAIRPIAGLTPRQEISTVVYETAVAAGIGLLVFGLSWLARLAVQLEALRGKLAEAAVAQERARVARDTHDLLGLGLSAVALKTDLIARLLARDDAAASAEIAELRRICAAASADIQLVTGQGQRLSLADELAAARELLESAGIGLRTDISSGPVPAAVDAMMAPVMREAVTNILRHSKARQCVIETFAAGGVLRFRVGNDGASEPAPGDGRAGHGLANLAARVEAAGGCLTCHEADGRFELIAEVPLAEPAGREVTGPADPPRVREPDGPAAGR